MVITKNEIVQMYGSERIIVQKIEPMRMPIVSDCIFCGKYVFCNHLPTLACKTTLPKNNERRKIKSDIKSKITPKTSNNLSKRMIEITPTIVTKAPIPQTFRVESWNLATALETAPGAMVETKSAMTNQNRQTTILSVKKVREKSGEKREDGF